MTVPPGRTTPRVSAPAVDPNLAQRLERGEVVEYAVCPFPLPEGDDRQFLLEQRLGSRAHKNISYDPHRDRASGYLFQSPAQAERLKNLLADFARVATGWLAGVLPRYAVAWKLDQVSFRPEEEATRKLRHKARNDLLHVDAFPSRPTNGYRILRLFTNVNLSEPRVWITSEPFPKLLERFGPAAGLPGDKGSGWSKVQQTVLGIFRPNVRLRSPYDEFMLRLHDFLKANDEFQERCFKRYWSFPPGSAWLAMTDTASHAALRGRFALEHSYFVAPETLALPEESPPALLARACGRQVLRQAG